MAILSLAINGFEPRLHDLAWPVEPVKMNMDASILVMGGDGVTLAVIYLETYQFTRLITQRGLDLAMIKLRAMSQWAYLVLGGYFRATGNHRVEASGHVFQMSMAAVNGARLSVQEHGVALMEVAKMDELPAAVELLAKRSRNEKRLKPPRDALFMEPVEDLLMSLPGIGPERAQNVLDHCNGSAAWSLVALTDDTVPLPGIGPETRRKVRAALGLEADMHFSVWVAEQKERAA